MADWQVNSIEQADQRLKDWVENVTGGTTCSLNAPSPAAKDPTISCYLLDLLEIPALRNVPHPSHQFSLRYLVTSWAKEPSDAHQRLNALVFAVLEEPELELEMHPPEPALWTALGVPPSPCFFLRVRVRLERPEKPPRLVLQPLKVEALPVKPLAGVVLGPEDVPVMGAVIEIPALQLSVRTGSKGQFRFKSVPEGGWLKRLVVKARGRTQEIALEKDYSEENPLIIHFDPLS
jgi:hypothetical protein